MAWFIITLIFTTILDIITISRKPTLEKDLEILVLRQQLSILQHKTSFPIRPSKIQKLAISVLTVKLKKISNKTTSQLKSVIRVFQPETVLRWHRELVRRKLTFKCKGTPGRPGISAELEALIIHLAKENSRWGYGKIQGELLKLGYDLSISSVSNVLKQNRIAPAAERSTSSWRGFLGQYKDQILACDFFTVETI